MQQVTVVGPNDVQLIETPEPKPGPRDVVVKVAACGICGSDLGYIAMGGMPVAGGGSSTPSAKPWKAWRSASAWP